MKKLKTKANTRVSESYRRINPLLRSSDSEILAQGIYSKEILGQMLKTYVKGADLFITTNTGKHLNAYS